MLKALHANTMPMQNLFPISVDETIQLDGMSVTGLKATHGPLTIKVGPFSKTVELGCGTGIFTELIVPKTTHIKATDLSKELLALAEKRLGNNPKVMIQKENCMATSLASGSFDSAFMANLVHVVENPFQVLQECHRLLRIGGVLIIVSYTNVGMHLLDKVKLGLRFIKAWGKPPRHTHIFSPERLAGLMEDAGFAIEEKKLIGNQSKAVFVIGKKV